MKQTNAFEVNNLRQIKATYIGPTDTRGSRICIFEPARYNDDKTVRKYFSYDYAIGDVMQQAYNILQQAGFNVVCRASERDAYIFLCDSWGDNFKKVSDL